MKSARWTALALAVATLLGGGCARKDVLFDRLRDVSDARAREALSDALWQSGSIFEWACHRTMRLEVVRTDHQPAGSTSSPEVWLLDLVDGRWRIEKTAAHQVTVFDGRSWRVLVGGRETDDLRQRAESAGDGLLVRQLATMPFGLLDPGLAISFAGTRTGPAEAKVWNRLFVTYAAAAGFDPADRMVVEVNQATRWVDAIFVCWKEAPFMGACWRVDMDEWFPADGLSVSRRWRLTPVNVEGAAIGPTRWTFEVKAVTFDVPVGAFDFVSP